MAFVEMDPDDVRKALAGYEDELAAEAKKLDAFYRQFRCQNCGGECGKEYDRRHAFADPDVLVPRAILRCLKCKALFDPFSGLRLELGNKALVRPEIPLIYPNDD